MAREFVGALGETAFERISWRAGTKGDITTRFVCRRARLADGENISQEQRLSDDETWIICEWRDGGEKKYYASHLPPDAPLLELARSIKARWSCEQMHQQMKQELGLDHYEGRSWLGLRRHCLLSMIAAFALAGQKGGGIGDSPRLPSVRRELIRCLWQPKCPHCGKMVECHLLI